MISLDQHYFNHRTRDIVRVAGIVIDHWTSDRWVICEYLGSNQRELMLEQTFLEGFKEKV